MSAYRNVELLAHSLTPRNVLHPQSIEYDIRYLHRSSAVCAARSSEHRKEQADMLNHKLFRSEIDAVANVVWVLYENKDAASKDFLACRGEDET